MPWRSSAEPMKGMDTLNEDFLEFIRLLESEKVQYLIVLEELRKLRRE